jgi:hypothetical protein
MVLLLALLLVLILFGAGFAVHILWIAAVVFIVLWLVRSAVEKALGRTASIAGRAGRPPAARHGRVAGSQAKEMTGVAPFCCSRRREGAHSRSVVNPRRSPRQGRRSAGERRAWRRRVGGCLEETIKCWQAHGQNPEGRVPCGGRL